MGNHLSCLSPCLHPPSIKLLHSQTGHLSEFHQPITVAELMLEYPNQFVCHSSSLQTGQRITPLSAVQDLKLQQLYILLPMHKLHTRLSSEEMAFLYSVITNPRNGKKLKLSQSSRVAPLLRVDLQEVEEKEKIVLPAPTKSASFRMASNPDELAGMSGGQHVMTRSRSWMPKLETIGEVSLS